jgi:hypothetical protein
MPMPLPADIKQLRFAAVACGIAGLLGWLFFYYIFRDTPGQDWMVFDTAVQAWRRGDNALILDGPRFTAILNQTHAAWLATPLVFHPWVYPPYTLLLVLPFAWLPFGVSYLGFQALSLAGLAFALRRWLPPGAGGVWLMLGVLLCPATAFTLGAGQNSFFSAALVVGGFALLATNPVSAGALLGFLAFKPQLAILVPVALVALGAWRAIAGAAGTALALLLASLVVPGLALWRGWLALFLGGDPAFQVWVNEGRLHGQSVFTCLHLLGVPNRIANLGQMVAVMVAGVCVWIGFRAPISAADRLAVLLCAMILAAAHVGNYDAILLGIAAMLVLTQAFVRPLRTGEAALAASVWIATAFNPPFVFRVSVVTPLLILALMLWLIWAPAADTRATDPAPAR